MPSAGFESITSRFVFFWKQCCVQTTNYPSNLIHLSTVFTEFWHSLALSPTKFSFCFRWVQATASQRCISWCNKKEIRLCLHSASVYEVLMNIFHLNLCQFRSSLFLWKHTWFCWIIVMCNAYTWGCSVLKVIFSKKLFNVNAVLYKLLKTK